MRKLLRWADRYEIPHVVILALYFSFFMWVLFEDLRAVMLYFAVSVLLYILYAVVSTIYSFVKRTLKKWREKEMEKKWREWVRKSWMYYLR